MRGVRPPSRCGLKRMSGALAAILSVMHSTGNRLEDFLPEAFTVLAFCEACDHQGRPDRTRVSAGVSVQRLGGRRQDPACGLHQTQVRIVYPGAGRFQYRQEETDGSAGA